MQLMQRDTRVGRPASGGRQAPAAVAGMAALQAAAAIVAFGIAQMKPLSQVVSVIVAAASAQEQVATGREAGDRGIVPGLGVCGIGVGSRQLVGAPWLRLACACARIARSRALGLAINRRACGRGMRGWGPTLRMLRILRRSAPVLVIRPIRRLRMACESLRIRRWPGRRPGWIRSDSQPIRSPGIGWDPAPVLAIRRIRRIRRGGLGISTRGRRQQVREQFGDGCGGHALATGASACAKSAGRSASPCSISSSSAVSRRSFDRAQLGPSFTMTASRSRQPGRAVSHS